MPSESYAFTRSSILFHPQQLGRSLSDGPCPAQVVEVPGTAPGSDPFITRAFIAIAGEPAGLI